MTEEQQESIEIEEDKVETNPRIIPKLIEDEMKKSYLDYSMSVIVGRALPDVRDGRKPAQRRRRGLSCREFSATVSASWWEQTRSCSIAPPAGCPTPGSESSGGRRRPDEQRHTRKAAPPAGRSHRHRVPRQNAQIGLPPGRFTTRPSLH